MKAVSMFSSVISKLILRITAPLKMASEVDTVGNLSSVSPELNSDPRIGREMLKVSFWIY